VEYGEELWQALLEWIRKGLGALGVFALDGHGFSIAASGEGTPVPPEVLMASFTSVAQLLEAYLSAGRPLEGLLISAANEAPVMVVALPWQGEKIFLGLHGGRVPLEHEIELIQTTIEHELAQFTSEKADS